MPCDDDCLAAKMSGYFVTRKRTNRTVARELVETLAL
jgi:hypothetical protein